MGTEGWRGGRGVRSPGEAPRSGEGRGNWNSVWCEVPGEGGWREEWRRSEEEVEKQSPGDSEFNQESEGGTGLTQAEPAGPSVGEGTLGGKWSRAHSGEPMSLSGLKDCLGWVCLGALHSLWAPWSCRRASPLPRGSGPLAGKPSRDPINQTRLS